MFIKDVKNHVEYQRENIGQWKKGEAKRLKLYLNEMICELPRMGPLYIDGSLPNK